MNETTRKLLSEALSRHEICMREVSRAQDPAEVVRRLVEIERASWSETPVEAENRPMTYRHWHVPPSIEETPMIDSTPTP